MKTSLLSIAFCMSFVLLVNSCSRKNKEVPPCDNKGKLCLTNKTDSAVKVTIKEAPNQFTLEKDNIQCVLLDGNVLYTISITGKKYDKDTSVMVSVCNEKDIIIRNY
jgi:ABC-type enterochelin transport system substrate-binding protein